MKKILAAFVVAYTPLLSIAENSVEGIWKTESSDSGGHLEVIMDMS